LPANRRQPGFGAKNYTELPHRAQWIRDCQESAMHPVIEVSGVRKTYGKTVAVEEASFEVNQGKSSD
jgi:hypothetical protein